MFSFHKFPSSAVYTPSRASISLAEKLIPDLIFPFARKWAKNACDPTVRASVLCHLLPKNTNDGYGSDGLLVLTPNSKRIFA